MKKIIGIIFLLIFLLQCTTTQSIATQEQDTQDEIIESQKSSLNINTFVDEAQRYTGEIFEDIDMNELLNAAIRGKIDHNIIGKNILKLLGKEVIGSITVIRKYHCYYFNT